MAYDRHEVWRNVADIYKRIEERGGPDGQVPAVEVYLAGREAPIITTVVETSKDPEYPWLKLYTGDETQNYIWADEDYLQRIEITFKPKGQSAPGFRIEVAD